MSVVANATPLIALSLVGRLELLRDLFGEVLVPAAVYDEVVVAGAGRPGADEVAQASWIRRQVPTAQPTIEPVLLGLDAGEFQVLLLAREVAADWVLIDERLARQVARAIGLRPKGTAGILLAAFEVGLVGAADVLAAVDDMLDAGIRMGPGVTGWLRAQMGV